MREELTHALHARRETERSQAIDRLGTLTEQDIVDIEKCLQDPDLDIRCAALEIIKRFPELAGLLLSRIITLLKSDSEWQVRAAATQLLGGFAAYVVEALRVALDDGDISVRSAAIHSLGVRGLATEEFRHRLGPRRILVWPRCGSDSPGTTWQKYFSCAAQNGAV